MGRSGGTSIFPFICSKDSNSVTLGPGSMSLSSIAHGLSSGCTSPHSCTQPAPGIPSPPGCGGHLKPTCSNKVMLVSLNPPFLLPHSPHLSFQLFPIGGDSDTIGAMAGSIAEAHYGVPSSIKEKILREYLDDFLRKLVEAFYKKI